MAARYSPGIAEQKAAMIAVREQPAAVILVIIGEPFVMFICLDPSVTCTERHTFMWSRRIRLCVPNTTLIPAQNRSVH